MVVFHQQFSHIVQTSVSITELLEKTQGSMNILVLGCFHLAIDDGSAVRETCMEEIIMVFLRT